MTVHPFYPLLKIASRSGMVAVLWVLLFAAGHSASHTATGYTDQRPVSSLAWAYSGGISENRSRLVLPESLSGADQDPAILPGLCLLYTSPSPRDRQKSRMPSSA